MTAPQDSLALAVRIMACQVRAERTEEHVASLRRRHGGMLDMSREQLAEVRVALSEARFRLDEAMALLAELERGWANAGGRGTLLEWLGAERGTVEQAVDRAVSGP